MGHRLADPPRRVCRRYSSSLAMLSTIRLLISASATPCSYAERGKGDGNSENGACTR
jgi:hypothetical protein